MQQILSLIKAGAAGRFWTFNCFPFNGLGGEHLANVITDLIKTKFTTSKLELK
jgi:hypothetical protein